MHQQLTLLVTDSTVFGIGFALLNDERIKLSVERFYLGQLLNAVCVEIAFRCAMPLDLVGMDIEKFARITRCLVLVKGFARLGIGDNLTTQLSYFRNAGVNFLYTVVQSRKLFTRGGSPYAELLAALDTMLLQIQESLGHLLNVENLCPLCVAAALARREFGLYVHEQSRALTIPARIMRRATSNDIAQLGLSVASAERM